MARSEDAPHAVAERAGEAAAASGTADGLRLETLTEATSTPAWPCRMPPAGTRPATTGRSSSATAGPSAFATPPAAGSRPRPRCPTAATGAGSRWCWWPTAGGTAAWRAGCWTSASPTCAPRTSCRCSTRRRPAPRSTARIGFVAGFEIDRWEWPAPSFDGPPPSAGGLRPAAFGDLEALVALDAAATGLDRRFLLAAFLARPGTRAWRADDGRGFVLARAGRRATQIGPLLASDLAQAASLLDVAIAAAADAGRAIFLDLPRAHRPLADRLERRGFVRQRPFVRMSLGTTEAPRLGAGMFVLAGPEFG